MALEANVQFFTGEDKILSFTIYQSDGSTAQNITGWSLSWMVKADKTDEDDEALVTKSGAGVTITNGAAGQCSVTVEDSDIAALVGGTRYYHELKRTDAGLETVLSYGTFRLTQAVHA